MSPKTGLIDAGMKCQAGPKGTHCLAEGPAGGWVQIFLTAAGKGLDTVSDIVDFWFHDSICSNTGP